MSKENKTTHKYIIDVEQIKEEKEIIIKIKNYPLLMNEKIFSAFVRSLEIFLRIFYQAANK